MPVVQSPEVAVSAFPSRSTSPDPLRTRSNSVPGPTLADTVVDELPGGVGGLAARARQALPSFSTLTNALASAASAAPTVSSLLSSLSATAGVGMRDDGAAVPPSDVSAWLRADVAPSSPSRSSGVPVPSTKAVLARVQELVDAGFAQMQADESAESRDAALRNHLEDLLAAIGMVADQINYALSARVTVMHGHDASPSGEAESIAWPVPMSSVVSQQESAPVATADGDAPMPDVTAETPSPLSPSTAGPSIPSPAAFDAMKRQAQDAVRRASATAHLGRQEGRSTPAASSVHLIPADRAPGMRIAAERESGVAPTGILAEPLAVLPLEASSLHARFAAPSSELTATFCPLEALQGEQQLRVVAAPSEVTPPASAVDPDAHRITAQDALDPEHGITRVDPTSSSDTAAKETLAVHALQKVEADARDAAAVAVKPAVRRPASHATRLHPGLRQRLLAAQANLPHPLRTSVRFGRGLRILCLDGGGIRGVLMLECLKKMEADCGRRVVDMFDLICGTSTGGFLAVALSMRKSLEDIAMEYEHIRATVGGQSSILSEVKRIATGTSHDHTVAETTLRSFFGDARMADLPLSPKVFVVCAAVNFIPVQPYLFRSYELTPEAFASAEILGTSQVPAALAVRATTSAPTYYAPAVIGTERMVDGAVVANNPTLIALSEAALLWPGARIDALVSLGTGTQSLRPSAANSVMTWIRTMLELALSSHVTHKIAATLLGDVYFRFDPDTAGDIDLVEVRVDVLARMLEDGRKYIQRMEPEFARLRRVLT